MTETADVFGIDPGIAWAENDSSSELRCREAARRARRVRGVGLAVPFVSESEFAVAEALLFPR